MTKNPHSHTSPAVTVSEAIDVALDAWATRVADGSLSPYTVEKATVILRRLEKFAATHDIILLTDLTPEVIGRFVRAQGRTRHGRVSESALATRHNRLANLRMLTQESIRRGWLTFDPTRFVDLEPRRQSTTRPITEAEAELLRFHADRGGSTRHAATIALLLAGAHSNEVGYVPRAGFDPDRGRVHSPGATGRRPRWLTLDPWELRVLTERADCLDRAPTDPYNTPPMLCTRSYGSESQRQARIGVTVQEITTRAGLYGDPTIRPSSLTAYAARRELERNGIEAAALRVGGVSLDHTAKITGYKWQPDSTEADS